MFEMIRPRYKPEHEPQRDHADRPEPRELAEAIQRRDAQHVQRDRPAEHETLVIPDISRRLRRALEARRLERKLEHPHVRSVRAQLDLELIEDLSRRRLKRVEPFADRG